MNWKRMVPVFVFVGALTLFANTAGAQYVQTNLVANRTGLQARNVDPNLINAWGLTRCQVERHGGEAESSDSIDRRDQDTLFCVADAFSGVATVYTSSGKPIPIVINIPAAPSLPPGTPGLPAGIVANHTSDFVISKNGKSGPALLLFATLDGTISGWNPDVDATNAVIIIDNSTKSPFPASYTDLSMARNKYGQNVIYATDSGASVASSNNEIHMYDGNFHSLGHFTDPSAPSDMTVYSAQVVHGKIYVTFAGFTPLDGGVVDVFDTEGNMLRRFATNSPAGPLQAPWAVVLAPGDFGWASHMLLIGGVDDGHINVFNPHTGAFLGLLKDNHGNPLIGNDGLWGLVFAPGRDEGKSNKLFFAAGPNGYADGWFGVISPVEDEGRGEGDRAKKTIP